MIEVTALGDESLSANARIEKTRAPMKEKRRMKRGLMTRVSGAARKREIVKAECATRR